MHEIIDPPASRWRRPLLVVGGLSLLFAGVWLNAERLGLRARPQTLAYDEISSTRQYVSYLQAPEDELEAESYSDDEESGDGRRHKGEEGKMGRAPSKNKSGLYAMKGPRVDPPLRTSRGEEPSGMNERIDTRVDPKSTFSIDVDTASYANMRHLVLSDMLPPAHMVRTEELVNYFDYDYPQPTGDVPFSVTTEVGPAPWNPDARLVHIGLQGRIPRDGASLPRNLVYLVDVSGSMDEPGKLPLVRHGLAALTEQLNPQDSIAIVVYAGAAGMVLPPTSGEDKEEILAALRRLRAGGSTNGAEGIELAYQLAREHFVEGGINRVILATDGDFNVGPSTDGELVEIIEAQRKSGVFLSVLAFGSDGFNDHMMERVADHGNGNYAYIDGPLEARKVLVEEASALLDTIAKDVKIQVEFDPAMVESHRLVGYENRVLAHADFDDDTKDAGEIGAGHSVTALYEIVPAREAEDGPIMTLDLRWKEPDADRSEKLSVHVRDEGSTLYGTSDDFRFSASVAAFAQKLRGGESESAMSYGDVFMLGLGAIGDDPHGYRREFLDLVRRVGHLPGTPLGAVVGRAPAPTRVDAEAAAVTDRWAFALEVLRLLPPLLALPLFVLAFRRPRRRRA